MVEQGAPGDAWQPASDHTVKMEYGANAENEVRLWNINSSNNGAVSGFYGSAKLYKTISKDGNWTGGKIGTIEEFKDFEGRVVLKRVWELENKSHLLRIRGSGQPALRTAPGGERERTGRQQF